MNTKSNFEAAVSPGQRPAQGSQTGAAASLCKGTAMADITEPSELPAPRVYRAAEGPMLEYFERGQHGPVARTVRIARITCEPEHAELVYTVIDRLLTRLAHEQGAGRSIAMAFDQAMRRAQNAEAALDLAAEPAHEAVEVADAIQAADLQLQAAREHFVNGRIVQGNDVLAEALDRLSALATQTTEAGRG